ncbi:MAG: efflux RND transporter periplasmic adaptor subunit [Acidobacteriota bacterium]
MSACGVCNADKMRTGRKLIGLAVLLAAGAGLWSCGNKADAEKNGGLSATRPAVAVDLLRLSPTALSEGVDVVGNLTPKFQAEVKTEYTGIVVDVYVTEWVRVRKGDELAKLDTREADLILQKAQAAAEVAQASLLEAEVARTRADREYDRAEKLKEVGLMTQQGLDEARSVRDAAVARVNAARAQSNAAEEDVKHARTRLDKAVIRAPMDGVVALRDVNVGDLVENMGSPKPMFRIVDNRLLDLTVTVPSKDIAGVRVGQRLVFSTDALPGKEFEGKVMFINPAVDETDRSVKIVAQVNNVPELLRGGLFVKGRIVARERPDVLQVPRTALLGWDVTAKTGQVYVVQGDVAHRRTVETGSASGDRVEVTRGLKAGDVLVVRGGFNLRDGDTVKVAGRIGG